jgi:hypothetical protein
LFPAGPAMNSGPSQMPNVSVDLKIPSFDIFLYESAAISGFAFAIFGLVPNDDNSNQ